jgi:hypothetical protein
MDELAIGKPADAPGEAPLAEPPPPVSLQRPAGI